MNRTSLYDLHLASGAKLVDFAGWEMPIQYSGVVDEYHSVRKAAGLFDVGHMGRVFLTGHHSSQLLQHVTTNDINRLAVGQAHYSMVCNPHGGIKDDIFVYRIGATEFLACINASNRMKLVQWLQEHARSMPDVDVKDRSEEIGQLAIQGPAALSILSEAGIRDLSSLRPRYCLQASLLGVSVLVTRTGYTGEPGYELYVPVDGAPKIWHALLTGGKSAGLKPAGLGSRDLLRLEMAYLLYGNDISEETTPLEANAGWLVSFDKGDFIGREALVQQREAGLSRRLATFELIEKAVPRHACPVVRDQSPGKPLGEVTSGNLSPLLQKGIGMAYVPPEYSQEGATFCIDIRGRLVPAVVVKPPFYKKERVRGQG